MRDLIYDRRNDPLSWVIKPCLLFLSHLYGFLVKCNNFFYDVNLLKSHKTPNRVISVGNITLGGTGKTPFTIMLARRLAERTKVAVIIRGYGEDEWRILRDRLGAIDARVFVGRDRVRLAKRVFVGDGRVVVLDDGFQHRRLARDLDIVLLDCVNPFGNGHMFPGGILREGLYSLRRSSIIVLTKVDKGKDNIATIERKIKEISPTLPVVKALHRPKGLFELWSGERRKLSDIAGKRVCIFSAICDPDYFRYTVEKTTATVELEFVFPDHYSYKKRDLEKIFKKCRPTNVDVAVTTEKDAVKLEKFTPIPNFRVFVLSIELEIIEGEKILNSKIDGILTRG